MTRVVVQRNLNNNSNASNNSNNNNNNSSQGRQSLSAPQSTTTSVPSSTNSSTSSHPQSNLSSLALSSSADDSGGGWRGGGAGANDGGASSEQINNMYGEDAVIFGSDLSGKFVASSAGGAFEGKASERGYLPPSHGDLLSSDDVVILPSRADDSSPSSWDGGHRGVFAGQQLLLSPPEWSGEECSSEAGAVGLGLSGAAVGAVVGSGGAGGSSRFFVGKGKEELVEDGRSGSNFVENMHEGGSSSSDDSGTTVVDSRTTTGDGSSSERSQAEEVNVLQNVQMGRASPPQQQSSSSLPPPPPPSSVQAAAGSLVPTANTTITTTTTTHTISSSPPDTAHGHEQPAADQARPNFASQGGSEAVGCSYVSITGSVPSPPVSSSSPASSRRSSWLGTSGSAAGPPPPVPPPRGGLSRRGARVSKPLSSRHSPNSSRPSSPRAYGEGDGYNSSDEHNSRSAGSTYENNEEREHQFEGEIRFTKNLELRRMAEDGNCLFRAVADQVYGDAEMYDEARQMCIDYMEKERDHFSQFVTESFTAYCKRKRRDKVYGNNLEIQAMAEMYNRPIHIYSYSPEPINIFQGGYETDLPPIRLSYHRGNHYNSLIDPGRPAVGAGLGFGSLRGTNVDREQVKAALKAQQDQQIDKALLAEGRFYSDIELTEQEIQRMVMEASRAEFFEEEKHRQYAPWSEETSTSGAAAEPSSSGTTGSPRSSAQTVSSAATSTVTAATAPAAADSNGLTPNMRMLMSMGFGYLQVMEAHSIFGDDVNNTLCYLLETDHSTFGDGESMYRKKGKAAER